MNYVQDNMFLGQLPKTLVIACVDSDALNGAIGKKYFTDLLRAVKFFLAVNPLLSVVLLSCFHTLFHWRWYLFIKVSSFIETK
jgi:hypothetical protein